MFRSLFRRNRTVRVPVEHSGHQLRQVKVTRAALSKPSNLITTFVVTYLAFRLYESSTRSKDGHEEWEAWKKKRGIVITSQQDPELSEHWKKAHEAHKKVNPDSDSSSSITSSSQGDRLPPGVISTTILPIWIRPRKGQLYQPDDPEFKDYVRIQSDQKKVADLKKQVANWAATRLNIPHHQANLKHIGFNGTVTFTLELVPQIQPPPLYEVPAIIIFKDGIAIGWKTMRPDLGARMNSMMRPTAAYNATKASLRTFFWDTYAITKAKVTGDNRTVAQLDAHLHAHAHAHSKSVTGAKESDKQNTTSPTSSWPSNSQAMQDLVKALHNGQTARDRHTELVKNLPFSTAVKHAAAQFRHVHLHGLAHHQQNKARGSIQIRGSMVCGVTGDGT